MTSTTDRRTRLSNVEAFRQLKLGADQDLNNHLTLTGVAHKGKHTLHAVVAPWHWLFPDEFFGGQAPLILMQQRLIRGRNGRHAAWPVAELVCRKGKWLATL